MRRSSWARDRFFCMRRSLFVAGIAIAVLTQACGPQRPASKPTPLAPPIEIAPSDATIEIRAPALGERVRVTEEAAGTMEINVQPKGEASVHVSLVLTTKEVREQTALEVSGDQITVMGLTYLSKTAYTRANGKTKSSVSPVVGHSYLVRVHKGVTIVTAPDGSEVDEAEAKVIRDEFKPAKKRPASKHAGVAAAPPVDLGPEVLHPGDRSEIWEYKFREAMGGDPGNVQDVDLRFAGVSRSPADQAVFKTSFTMLVPVDDSLLFTIGMSGTWAVFLDSGRSSVVNLSGPVQITSANSANGSMNGTGTMAMLMKWERL